MREDVDVAERPYNVLFLCTHNSARSIMAEVILNDLGQGKVQGRSRLAAIPEPRRIPFALETLAAAAFPTDGLYSKDWDEFASQRGAR